MDYSQITNLFTPNYEAIRHSFVGDYASMDAICAVMCIKEGKTLDIEKIKGCKEILKQHKGVFSDFRDNMRIPVAVKMALADDPEAYLEGLTDIYDRIQSHFVFGSEQTLMAAMIIYDNAPEEIRYRMPDETFEVFEKMKADHPLLTSKDDLPIAAFIAMNGGNYDEVFNYIEECHEILTKRFFISRDAVQSVAQVFALNMDRSPEEKCVQFNEYYDILKKNKMKIEAGPQLAVLGILVNMNVSADEIMEYIGKYEAFLKTQKGFGILGTDSQSRRAIAAAMYFIEKYSDGGMSSEVLSTILNLIIEFELIMLMIIIISTNAAVAASAGN